VSSCEGAGGEHKLRRNVLDGAPLPVAACDAAAAAVAAAREVAAGAARTAGAAGAAGDGAEAEAIVALCRLRSDGRWAAGHS